MPQIYELKTPELRAFSCSMPWLQNGGYSVENNESELFISRLCAIQRVPVFRHLTSVFVLTLLVRLARYLMLLVHGFQVRPLAFGRPTFSLDVFAFDLRPLYFVHPSVTDNRRGLR